MWIYDLLPNGLAAGSLYAQRTSSKPRLGVDKAWRVLPRRREDWGMTWILTCFRTGWRPVLNRADRCWLQRAMPGPPMCSISRRVIS